MMKRTVKWAGIGAAIGCVAVTVFATGEMLGSPGHPETAVVVILALAMGGLLIGVPAGAAVGAILALLTQAAAARRRAEARASTRQVSEVPRTMGPTADAMATLEQVRAQPRRPAPSPTPPPRVSATRPAPLAPVLPAPVRSAPERVDLSDPERLNKVLTRLDSLIGLEPVAAQVRAVAHRVAFEVQRAEALGVERGEIGMHALFLGPPGAGKTEVARIWGEVLCALGLLPTDRVVEVSRQDLVAAHVGETAGKTRAVLEGARGGVFFLDEAYALAPRTGQDFGPEAVAELLAFMENNRTDFAVIAAGYEA